MSLIIRYKTVGTWNQNSYIVEFNGNSILIDPGDNFIELDTFFALNKSNHKVILNTHGHFDHIGSVQDFRLKYNIPFYIHSMEKRNISQSNLLRKFTGDNQIYKIPDIDFFIDKQETYYFIDKEIKIYHLPGHSAGSICIQIDKNLFCGDTIFENGIGRTDLPGSNKKDLFNSVNFILNNFKDFKIFPGHNNPFILNNNIIDKLRNYSYGSCN